MRTVTVGQLISDHHVAMSDGYRTKRSELANSGFRIVRVADVRDGEIKLDSPDFVDPEFAGAIGAKAGRVGDILLTTKGTVGRVAQVKHLDEPIVYSPQLCYFRIDDAGPLRPTYFRYWLQSAEFMRQARNIMGNTDMAPYINLVDLRALRISVPEPAVQDAIGQVLGALDDKITGNERISHTGRELTLALFEKAARAASASIPLAEVADVVRGVSYRSNDLTESDTALVTLKSITRNGEYAAAGLKSYAGPYGVDQVLRDGDIALAQTDLTQAAEVVGRAVRVRPSSRFSRLVASLDIAIIRPNGQLAQEYLFGALSHRRFQRFCQSHTSGTTVLHLKLKSIDGYDVPLPSPEHQDGFARAVRPVHDRIDAAVRENETLTALRDALLPQLMSGRLRVADIEQQLEMVL